LADRGPDYRNLAGALSHRALDRFRAGETDDWFHGPEFTGLALDRQEIVRRRAAGLMLVLANLRAHAAECEADAATREDLLRQAREWNRRAELTHPDPDGCRAVWVQRGYLTRLAGDPAEAERLVRKAVPIPSTPADVLLEGRQYLIEKRYQAALKVLEPAVKADPTSLWAVFYASVCQQYLGEDAKAKAGYDICEALRPGFFGTLFNRGMARYRLGQVAEAEADFDRAIGLRPEWADAYFQRALAREARDRHADAMDDLNRSLERGHTPTAVYFQRSRVYKQMGDTAAAEREFAEGMKAVPTDERGWMARALARLYRGDPAGALADFDQALRLNPTLILALQGKAHLLSKSGKTAEATQALTRIIDLNPDSPDAWSGRGVLRARTGDRDGALADAREALRQSERPATKYQVAGIYGLMSKTHPEDRREAFSLLDGALRGGFGFDLLDKDPELDPIRKDPEFRKIVDAARAYRASLKKMDD
jgi:tetratricopeptide (TPR) repeat protein